MSPRTPNDFNKPDLLSDREIKLNQSSTVTAPPGEENLC
jgi:hypothetical protein